MTTAAADRSDVASQQGIEILLVENEQIIAQFAAEMLREADIAAKINHVRDGVQALAFLRRQGLYRGAARPELILLDFDLPRLDGRDLLAEISRDFELRAIPVIVLTGGTDGAHLAKAVGVPADGLAWQPVEKDEFVAIVRAIAEQSSESVLSAAMATAAKPQFLVDLGHQLRTHLNPIIAFSEMMAMEIRGPLDKDYREYARGIHQSALVLSRIVLNLLDPAGAASPWLDRGGRARGGDATVDAE